MGHFKVNGAMGHFPWPSQSLLGLMIFHKFCELYYTYKSCYTSIFQAIWNWMDNYPDEFTELQNIPNDELAGRHINRPISHAII